MESDLYTSDELIKKFKISKQTLYDWMEKNNFPKPIKIGRRVYWKKNIIETYIEKLSSEENK